MRNTTFADVQSEDAVNLIHSIFSIENATFENTVSDGIDSDFSSGNITKSVFRNIGGDAFDLSGLEVKMSNTLFLKLGIKAYQLVKTVKFKFGTLNPPTVGLVS